VSQGDEFQIHRPDLYAARGLFWEGSSHCSSRKLPVAESRCVIRTAQFLTG
jgi:hypothetical protein